jgi:hypothetical protein
MSSDLWAITCYFNPCRYKTKRENYDAFIEGMKAVGANIITAELAFGDEEFELEPGDNVLQLRGWGLMWQKERLLNIAASRLPDACKKVAWLDNDLIFENPNWVEQTSKALDRYMVVQPYTNVVRLPRGTRKFDGRGEKYVSFGHVFAQNPGLARTGEFYQHGHSGFAWAARRELIDECGLYDACLTCSGDHLMTHAFAGGMIHSPCLPRMIGPQKRYLEHFWKWATKARDMVNGRIGPVPGRVLHLWHGELADRRYARLNQEFMTFDFDPEKHLRFDESGLWEWTDETPEPMRKWASEMFWMRREDGDPALQPQAGAA